MKQGFSDFLTVNRCCTLKKIKKKMRMYCFQILCITFAYKTKEMMMETVVKKSTTFRLNAEQVANETTQGAIREAMDMQNAYKSGTLKAKPIDLSSVDNMLRSMDL